jgi:hypothetical protein
MTRSSFGSSTSQWTTGLPARCSSGCGGGNRRSCRAEFADLQVPDSATGCGIPVNPAAVVRLPRAERPATIAAMDSRRRPPPGRALRRHRPAVVGRAQPLRAGRAGAPARDRRRHGRSRQLPARPAPGQQARAVTARRWGGVAGGLLHVPLVDPGSSCDPPHDPRVTWRSSRPPSARRKIGSAARSPIARSMARATRGAKGIVTILPPLRHTGCGVRARGRGCRCRRRALRRCSSFTCPW